MVLPAFDSPAWAQDNSTLPQNERLFSATGTFLTGNGQNYVHYSKWLDVIKRYQNEKENPTPGREKEHAEWQALVVALKDPALDLQAKLEAANAAINRYRYVSAETNWDDSLYWETPFELLRKGGQCQDFAIAKYLLLREANVLPDEDLQFVAVYGINLGGHAVLIANIDGQAWVLDSNPAHPKVVPDTTIKDYFPLDAVSLRGVWTFIPSAPSARQALGGDPNSVRYAESGLHP